MQLNNRPLLIGITGNIGSGKSSFCNYLAANGLRIISADVLANQHLEDKDIQSALVTRYSPDILTTSVRDKNVLTINRKLLADKVFISETETNYLNSLIRPLVLQDFQQIAEQSQEKVLCFEVPLLFEANLQDCFDYLILISASKEKRLDRLEKKGEEKSKAEKRIMHQIPDINKRNLVDLVIENNNDIDALHKAADNFANHISEIKLKEVRPFILV